MKRIKQQSERLRGELLGLAREDGEAFEAVLDAVRMPQTSPAEMEARTQAMATAQVGACRVPLRTAAACIEVIELAAQAAKLGNRNAVTDAGVAGLLAQAAAEGALLNVQINLKSLAAGADKQGVEMDLHRLAATLRRASEDCRSAVTSTIDAS
jgi:glutamate formiminotransferase/formiminotetrahydrofolate cyclodeaminase